MSDAAQLDRVEIAEEGAHLTLTLAVDVLSLLPVSGQIIAALRLANDVIVTGEELHKFLHSEQGAPVKQRMDGWFAGLGLRFSTTREGGVDLYGSIPPELRPQPNELF